MKLEFLHKMFDENENYNVLQFNGTCEKCGEKTSIVVRLTEQGFDISGGAMLDERTFRCDNCMKTEVYTRTVGYLRLIDAMHKSKQKEVRDRKMFRLSTA